jgi:hypothetical protein
MPLIMKQNNVEQIKKIIKKIPMIKNLQNGTYTYNHITRQVTKSIVLLLLSSYIMSFIDALAWYRMPRYEEKKMNILSDIGYEIIPYNCPLKSPQNIQTYILDISLIINLIMALLSKNGLFVLQRYAHITSIVYLLRAMVVSLTSYPNPNPVCSSLIKNRRNLFGKDSIMRHVFSSLPTHSCGNLMFSGHAASLTLLFWIEGKYDQINNKSNGLVRVITFIRIIKTVIGYYSIIACRSHYTADVVMGIMVSSFVFIISETHFKTSKMLTTIEMQSLKKVDTRCCDEVSNTLILLEEL